MDYPNAAGVATYDLSEVFFPTVFYQENVIVWKQSRNEQQVILVIELFQTGIEFPLEERTFVLYSWEKFGI